MDQVNVILLLTLSFTCKFNICTSNEPESDCIGGSVYDGVNGDSVVDPGGFWYLNSNLPTTCSGDVLRYNIEYNGTGSLTVSLWSPTDSIGNYEKVQNSEFHVTSPTNTFDVSNLAVRKGAIVGVYLSDSNPLQVISNVTGQSVQNAGVCVSSSDLAATEIVCSDKVSLILKVDVEIDIIDCGNPSGGTKNFNNGEIFLDEDMEFGAVIRYSCNTGYSLVGNANRTCQADGDWIARPMCIPDEHDCGSVDPPENGEIVDSETIETTFNSVIEFMCSTGYMLNGAKSITCQSDGSWSADVPTCDIINLPTSSIGLSTQLPSSAMSSPIPSVDSVQDGGLSAGGIAAIVIILLMVIVAIVVVMIALLIWMRRRSPNRKKPKMENGGISNELYGVTGTVHTQQNSPSIQESTVFSTTLPSLPPRNDRTTSSVLGTSLPGYYDIAEMKLLKNDNTINAVYTDVQVYSEVGPVPDVYSSPDEGRYGIPDANPYEVPSRQEKEIYIQLEKNRVLAIPNDRVEVTTYLGSGQFGTVHQAVLSHQGTEIDVAVKTLKHEASEEEKIKFLQEAATMGQFHNTNVVKLFGVVTDNPKNLMLVVELLKRGDLHQFLMKMRPKETSEILPQSTPLLLLSFCRQICLGMTYLSGKGFVHRDLAARNILLSGKNICKIADFGMSRDITDDNYYVATEGSKIPVKWTAPEALTYRKYSSTSDVWSFGCVLYEIWAVGTKPFQGRSNQEAMLMIENGYRLPPPPGCPKPIYETMIQCWHPEPKGRPNFHDIMLVFLGHDQSILEIPENDLATHPLAGILSADLQAGENMYKTLQNTYIL